MINSLTKVWLALISRFYAGSLAWQWQHVLSRFRYDAASPCKWLALPEDRDTNLACCLNSYSWAQKLFHLSSLVLNFPHHKHTHTHLWHRPLCNDNGRKLDSHSWIKFTQNSPDAKQIYVHFISYLLSSKHFSYGLNIMMCGIHIPLCLFFVDSCLEMHNTSC